MLLHNGCGQEPPESDADWLVSRICESFNCTPSVAEAEWDRDPIRIMHILELRAFRDAKLIVESADDMNALQKQMTPIVRQYLVIENEVMVRLGQGRPLIDG